MLFEEVQTAKQQQKKRAGGRKYYIIATTIFQSLHLDMTQNVIYLLKAEKAYMAQSIVYQLKHCDRYEIKSTHNWSET